jgi:cyclase
MRDCGSSNHSLGIRVPRPRIIPSLLIERGRLVKTIAFENPRYVGDPVNSLRIFSEFGADEVYIQDRSAAKCGIDFDTVEAMASEAFVPVVYGGGVCRVDDAKRLVHSGVERVAITTAFLDDPGLVTKIADVIGQSSTIVGIDVVEGGDGAPYPVDRRTMFPVPSGLDALIEKACESGAGEISVNCVTRDGTRRGISTTGVSEAVRTSSVPVLYEGGVGRTSDIQQAIRLGVAGVVVGSFFLFVGSLEGVLITYPTLAQRMEIAS